MKTKPNNKWVLLDSVRNELVFPHTGVAIDPRALQRYLVQLGVKAHLEQVNGKGPVRQHVTPDQAQAIKDLFKAKHWRKFMAAEADKGRSK